MMIDVLKMFPERANSDSMRIEVFLKRFPDRAYNDSMLIDVLKRFPDRAYNDSVRDEFFPNKKQVSGPGAQRSHAYQMLNEFPGRAPSDSNDEGGLRTGWATIPCGSIVLNKFPDRRAANPC